MSEQDRARVTRLDALMGRMTDTQKLVFVARGEGMVDGYKMGQADAARQAAQTAAPRS